MMALALPLSPNVVTGLLLFLAAITTIIWGAFTLADALRRRGGGWRAVIVSFRFWLGMFLLTVDGVLYTLLGERLTHRTQPPDAWFVALAHYWAFVTFMAFVTWLREKRGL